MFKPLQNLINRGQWLQLDIGLYLARSGEGQRFGHILARSHERTSNRNTLSNDIKQRNREIAWWQTYEDASPAPARHADALLKCG